jgi:putative sterol carrier protein
MTGQIEQARAGALRFLKSMEISPGIYTNSTFNKPVKIRGMTLPATYNAVHCLKLLGAETGDSALLADFFNSFQHDSGAWRIPEMRAEDLYHPWFDSPFEYDDFHLTNYALGALEGLGRPQKPLAFLSAYDTREKLAAWLQRRDMRNPWVEGNYMVNLASFYFFEMQNGGEQYQELVEQMLDWHLKNQDAFGYWHDPSIEDLVSAMAGAAHNFHLFYFLNRPVPRYRNIIDHCLSLPNEISSACIDIDIVDILGHFHAYGYRTADIAQYLAKKLADLLAVQQADGGFYDTTQGVRLFDGWKAYEEPQGLSNCFATWFRMASIGICACILYPEQRGDWHFRKGIGIGYFNPEYLSNGFDEPEELPAPVYQADGGAELPAALPCGKETLELMAAMEEKVAGTKDNLVCVFYLKDGGVFTLDLSAPERKLSAGAAERCDLRVETSLKTLAAVLEGRLLPTVAYAMKKIKLKGDMGKALKLVACLGKRRP